MCGYIIAVNYFSRDLQCSFHLAYFWTQILSPPFSPPLCFKKVALICSDKRISLKILTGGTSHHIHHTAPSQRTCPSFLSPWLDQEVRLKNIVCNYQDLQLLRSKSLLVRDECHINVDPIEVIRRPKNKIKKTVGFTKARCHACQHKTWVKFLTSTSFHHTNGAAYWFSLFFASRLGGCN